MSLDYRQTIITGYKVPYSKVFEKVKTSTEETSCNCNKNETKFCPVCGKEWKTYTKEKIVETKVFIPELWDEKWEYINFEREERFDIIGGNCSAVDGEFFFVGKVLISHDPISDGSNAEKIILPTQEEIDELIGHLPIRDCDFGCYFVSSVY